VSSITEMEIVLTATYQTVRCYAVIVIQFFRGNDSIKECMTNTLRLSAVVGASSYS
jgi:hypothetical protein